MCHMCCVCFLFTCNTTLSLQPLAWPLSVCLSHLTPPAPVCRYGMRGFWAKDAKPVVLTRDKIEGIHLNGKC